jgi:hypothetical protein
LRMLREVASLRAHAGAEEQPAHIASALERPNKS